MGRLRIRISGNPQDVEAFASFLQKVSERITALQVISLGENRTMRQSTDVMRYTEVEFDSSAMQGE